MPSRIRRAGWFAQSFPFNRTGRLRVDLRTARRAMSSEPQHRPFGKWTLLLLVWNGLGAVLALYILSYGVILEYEAIAIPLAGPILSFWVPSLPFTTLGVMLVLWRSRHVGISRLLLIASGTILVLWGGFIVTVFALLGGLDG